MHRILKPLFHRPHTCIVGFKMTFKQQKVAMKEKDGDLQLLLLLSSAHYRCAFMLTRMFKLNVFIPVHNSGGGKTETPVYTIEMAAFKSLKIARAHLNHHSKLEASTRKKRPSNSSLCEHAQRRWRRRSWWWQWWFTCVALGLVFSSTNKAKKAALASSALQFPLDVTNKQQQQVLTKRLLTRRDAVLILRHVSTALARAT